jgi:hypothetical protein
MQETFFFHFYYRVPKRKLKKRFLQELERPELRERTHDMI